MKKLLFRGLLKNYKKIIPILSTLLMIFCSLPGNVSGAPGLNYRDIQIGDIKNTSESVYDYIGKLIKANLTDALKKIPYITIPTNERKILAAELGIPDGEISSRLPPRVIKKDGSNVFLPIYISGEYSLDRKTDIVSVKIEMENRATGIHRVLANENIPINDLVLNPGPIINKAIKNLVKYKLYTISLVSLPENAEIYVDRSFVGKGSVNNFFILPGYHTFTAMLEGYRDYSEVININNDNMKIELPLEPYQSEVSIQISTQPLNSTIYFNEKLIGKTPDVVSLTPGEEDVIVLKKDGFRSKMIPINEKLWIPQEGERPIKYKISTKLINQQRIPVLIETTEKHKKKAKLYSYIGFGFLGASILLGTQKTIEEQKSDIYGNMGNENYEKAKNNSELLRYLTWGGAGLTIALFTKSFMEILKYFNGYKELSIIKNNCNSMAK
ncbi:MAG: hypothetical protein DRP54_03000 [Spirochaetes bacterium]|nr:MAG: hypothetical protein DRP54_03000 [Spirochaetota bacterium]